MAATSTPEEVADPKLVRKEFRQVAAEARLLDARWDELVSEHRDQWVGVHKKNFMFAESLEELLSGARESGWDVGTLVVDRLVERRLPSLL